MFTLSPLKAKPKSPTALRPVSVVASGRYLPGEAVPSTTLDLKLGLAVGTLEKMTGVRQRYYSKGEHAAQVGAKAAKAALANGGFTLADIDLLLCVSGSPDQIVPSNASLLLAELDPKSTGLPCFDINSTCLSFVVGLDTISYAMAAGRYKRVLMVAAELPSLGLNPKELEAYGLFGDAGAAVIIEAHGDTEGPRILAAQQESYAAGVDFCQIFGGAGRLPSYRYSQEDPSKYLFHMDGSAVFKLASKVLPAFMDKLLGEAGVKMKDIGLVIPHQASLAAMEIMRRKFDIAEDRMMCTLPSWGNNIAASIPLALDEARNLGLWTKGKKILLLGTSAGFSVGGLVLEA